MTRRTLWAGALAGLLAVTPIFSQEHDISGAWQGTLHTPRGDLRVVMKVSKDASGYKAMMYSIDQGGNGLPASSVALQGGNIKIAVPALGGVYEGKFSNTDGTAITGTWTQGAATPLDMTLATEKTAWTIPEPPPLPTPMAENADPSWEAATIKLSDPERQGIGINMNGRNFSTHNTTLRDLLTFTYGLHPNQILGAPGWVETDKFDLAARPDTPGMPSDLQIKSMMKKLIAERFKLKFHTEKKELSVFLITVAKGGPKLTKNDSDPKGLPGLG
ncbi:MAG TPA: TIGR03435 family protein, partial [Bryobacteraceae bacterium]